MHVLNMADLKDASYVLDYGKIFMHLMHYANDDTHLPESLESGWTNDAINSYPTTRRAGMLLENKNVVIYGAGGAIGSAVAHAFAREGASDFLRRRILTTVEVVAQEIADDDGITSMAQFNDLGKRPIEDHLNAVAQKVGLSIFPSMPSGFLNREFRASRLSSCCQRLLLTRLQLTTTAAARSMVEQHADVILTLTATPARMASPLVGGIGVA